MGISRVYWILLTFLALATPTWADPGDSDKLVPFLIFGLGPILVMSLPVLVLLSILRLIFNRINRKDSSDEGK